MTMIHINMTFVHVALIHISSHCLATHNRDLDRQRGFKDPTLVHYVFMRG